MSVEERVRESRLLLKSITKALDGRLWASLEWITLRALQERVPALAGLVAEASAPFPVGDLMGAIHSWHHIGLSAEALHTQRRATQIRNRVVECRDNLDGTLREIVERRREDDR